MKNYLLFILVIVIFSSCSKKDSVSSTTQVSGLVPLKVGNYWLYIDSTFYSPSYTLVDTSRLTITDSKTINVNGSNYQVYLWSWNDTNYPNISIFVNNETTGFYIYGGTNGDKDFILGRNLVTKFPVNVGESWNYNDYYYSQNDTCFLIYGSSQMRCLSVDSVFKSSIGERKCTVYQSTTNSKDLLKCGMTNLPRLKYSNILTISNEFYCLGIGYMGSVETCDGDLIFKKTLLSYHLN
jgi:hypothetical protein